MWCTGPILAGPGAMGGLPLAALVLRDPAPDTANGRLTDDPYRQRVDISTTPLPPAGFVT